MKDSYIDVIRIVSHTIGVLLLFGNIYSSVVNHIFIGMGSVFPIKAGLYQFNDAIRILQVQQENDENCAIWIKRIILSFVAVILWTLVAGYIPSIQKVSCAIRYDRGAAEFVRYLHSDLEISGYSCQLYSSDDANIVLKRGNTGDRELPLIDSYSSLHKELWIARP